MAMGMSFPGWEARQRQRKQAALLHLLGSSVGGATVGAFLGALGGAIGLGAVRSILLAAVVAYTAPRALVAVRRGRAVRGYGLQRQVPRRLRVGVSAGYFLWGSMLGAGILTVVPYGSFLVLLTAQAGSGVALAAASGALFGLGREGPTLLTLAGRQDISTLSELLRTMMRPAQRLNLLLIVVGGGLLTGLSAVARLY